MLTSTTRADPLALNLRERSENTSSSRAAEWDPAKTAIVICDMWDSHHSVTAVRRVNEFAPRLNVVLSALRARGVTIIHSPSDCMPAYEGHPARKRALGVPGATAAPPDIGAWCHRIPAEEKATYPIDQSDGGEDESEWEDAEWTKRLKADGRNPGTPWLKQNDRLMIDEGKDYIAAEGDVVWNILQQQGVEHVILAGVHTNMCVLGRPFGLRQMVRAGMETVLLRDCTDVMYNPARWPYVSHFTGLDLVIEHIERHVCATITSDQIVGGEPFRFQGDSRPHVSVMVKGSGYLEEIRRFTRRYLDPSFRVSFSIAGVGEDVRGDSEADLYLVASEGSLPGKGAFGSKPAVFIGREHLPDGRWIRSDGGRSANIKGGSFGEASFDRELFEALCWASDVKVPEEVPSDPDLRREEEGWGALGRGGGTEKYRDLRTLLRAPSELENVERQLLWPTQPNAVAFINGEPLERISDGVWAIDAKAILAGDLNLLVLRVSAAGESAADLQLPNPPRIKGAAGEFKLDSVHWQERYASGGEPEVTFPIPPQFGAPTDLVQNWGE